MQKNKANLLIYNKLAFNRQTLLSLVDHSNKIYLDLERIERVQFLNDVLFCSLICLLRVA